MWLSTGDQSSFLWAENKQTVVAKLFRDFFCGIAKHFQMFDCALFVITYLKIIGGILKSPTMTPAIKFESQPVIRPISSDVILEQTWICVAIFVLLCNFLVIDSLFQDHLKTKVHLTYLSLAREISNCGILLRKNILFFNFVIYILGFRRK